MILRGFRLNHIKNKENHFLEAFDISKSFCNSFDSLNFKVNPLQVFHLLFFGRYLDLIFSKIPLKCRLIEFENLFLPLLFTFH